MEQFTCINSLESSQNPYQVGTALTILELREVRPRETETFLKFSYLKQQQNWAPNPATSIQVHSCNHYTHAAW